MSKAEDNLPVKVYDAPCGISIFIGSAGSSRNRAALEAAGIGRIVCCHQTLSSPYEDSIEYFIVPVKDKPGEDIARYFAPAIAFIQEAEKNVLVHCMQGKSRSAAIIAAYLIHSTNVDLPRAMDIIRTARAGAEPNLGFAAQLRAFARKSNSALEDTGEEAQGSGG